MADAKKPPDDRSTEFPLLKDDSVPGVSDKPSEAAPSAEPKPTAEAAERIIRTTLAERLVEQAPEPRLLEASSLKRATRRDFLLFGASALAAAAGFWKLLPEQTQQGLGDTKAATSSRKERFLNGALSFDDDVARVLYSPYRLVPTYSKSQITPGLINNYNGQTPDSGYLSDWQLTMEGLATGKVEKLSLPQLLSRFNHYEQITRLVCVEGWSAIAWWGGLRFADLLAAYPPAPGARWARLDSAVNLDSDGNPDPYYVSIDLPTARHPQTLLATHRNGQSLEVEHGAPLRLVAPMKLGLKNIKAVTKITYSLLEPADYWAQQGYSKYDGL